MPNLYAGLCQTSHWWVIAGAIFGVLIFIGRVREQMKPVKVVVVPHATVRRKHRAKVRRLQY
jgi:hypothetical protein